MFSFYKSYILPYHFFGILLLFISVSEIFPNNYWLRQQSPTTKWLYKCHFTDSLYGWAAGDSGIIVHTSNGGGNWTIQNSTINYFIEDLFFLNRRLGWAIANDFFYFGTTILKTTNGGINWSSSRYPDTTLFLNTIYFLDSLNGWMGGFGGVILRTTNGGVNWSFRTVDSSFCSGSPIRQFAFYSNPVRALACGGYFDVAGVVWSTTNSGMFWIGECVSPEPINDLFIIDSLNVIGAGGDFEYGASIVKTTNGGINWEWTALNFFGAGQAISFRTPAEAWVPLGFSGNWIYTLDSCRSWSEFDVPDSASAYDVQFTDPYHGWSVGNYGRIFKYNTLKAIGINNQSQNELPNIYKLYQNYPNPFNPSTTIEYYLLKPSRVKIILYDLLGREIRTLLHYVQRAGKHKINFNSDWLSSGIYYYKLETDDGFTDTKKMVILR